MRVFFFDEHMDEPLAVLNLGSEPTDEQKQEYVDSMSALHEWLRQVLGEPE